MSTYMMHISFPLAALEFRTYFANNVDPCAVCTSIQEINSHYDFVLTIYLRAYQLQQSIDLIYFVNLV